MVAILLIQCSTEQKEVDQQAIEPESTSTSERPVHWGYAGEDDPTAWAALSPVYPLCGEGKGQSSINIVKTGLWQQIETAKYKLNCERKAILTFPIFKVLN
jgi:carbonic anhydrase